MACVDQPLEKGARDDLRKGAGRPQIFQTDAALLTDGARVPHPRGVGSSIILGDFKIGSLQICCVSRRRDLKSIRQRKKKKVHWHVTSMLASSIRHRFHLHQVAVHAPVNVA